MMSSVSWKEYFIFLSIALVCYYSIIVLVYFQNELLQLRMLLLRQANNRNGSKEMSGEMQFPSRRENEPVSGDVFKLVVEADEHIMLNELLEKLGQEIETAARRSFLKEELLISIQLVLNQYSNLQYSSFLSSIENYIQSDVENQCSIYLTDQEVSLLWKK